MFKGNILKIYMHKLWLLYLIALYQCMNVRWKTCNSYQIIERTRNNIANDQREITPDISKAELWFLRMIHCALEVYEVSTKSLNSVQLTEWTKNCI